MKKYRMKMVMGTLAGVMGMAGIAAAADVAVGVDVNTPNARVQVSTAPAPPRPVVVEREHVARVDHYDHGRHRGHYKKHHKIRHHRD